jgi:hypothetical protein
MRIEKKNKFAAYLKSGLIGGQREREKDKLKLREL